MVFIQSSRPAFDALRVCSGCRLQLFKQDPSSLARFPASIPLITVRHATHGAQGRANGPKNGPGKRLGAKKTGDEYVIPGNIIFRQRGTKWFPGENVGIGRDHTLFSLVHGYVKFYRDPLRHPKRSYIGVTFDKNDTLPYSRQAPRKRRLGMIAVPRAELQPLSEVDVAKIEEQRRNREMPGVEGLPEDGPMVGAAPATRKAKANPKNPTGAVSPEEIKMRPDYSYREANWQIGRAAERAGVKVKLFKPGDRWTAWQKRTAKRKRAIAKRAMGRKGKQANAKRRTRPMGKQ